MPWEKSFNEDKAINAAMTLFWEKGYTDSSMADLLKVTGLTKGSFYNAFGSKHALFEKALLKYDLETRRQFIQELAALDAPLKAIETFLEAIVNDTVKDPKQKGCFVINLSLQMSFLEENVQKIVKNAFMELEVFFKQMIELGQLRGEIPNHIDPQIASKSLVGTVVSIRVLGRGVFETEALFDLAKQGLSLLE